jgi:hypothetical protein
MTRLGRALGVALARGVPPVVGDDRTERSQLHMDDNVANPSSRRIGLKVALVGAGLAAGVIGATALGANATSTSGSGTTAHSATGNSSTGSSTGTAGSAGAAGPAANGSGGPAHGSGRAFDHGGSTPVRSDEKSLTASLTAKLKAAALKAVSGGTVYRIESDAGDGTYEAHMTKADGSLVTVKFDKNGNVTKVESGMGTGDPAPQH